MANTFIQVDSQDPNLGNNELRREIMQRYQYASKNLKEWSVCAKEDMAFALGDQWSDEDRQALNEQGRPALTFNRIKPILSIISGYQRENSSRIKVSPEGGEDKIFSEVMDRLTKFVGKASHLPDKMSYWFDDGVTTGKGWLEAVITYEKDPIRGELRFLQRTPYQILVDPDFNEYDLNEYPRASYLFKVLRVSRETLKMLYPKYKKLITGFITDEDDVEQNGTNIMYEGTDDDYGNRPNVTTKVERSDHEEESGLKQDDKFTVKEYWRPKMVSKYFVINKENGLPRKFDTKEQAEAFTSQQKFGKVIERKVPEMWVAAMVGGFVVQDEKSSFEPYYNGFPFFRFLAEWSPSANSEKLRVQGIVRQLKDPQMEKNKSKSQTLHILSTQANSGWVGDEDALSIEGWKDLEKMGSKPGITVKKKKGAELREIQPKGPNVGHLQREREADDEFKQISAVNPDLLGMKEGTESGRAISMRIRQAILALVKIFHNYKYSKEIIGKFILQMIPSLFDSQKARRVLGPHYMKGAIDKEKYPEGLTPGILDAFMLLVEDNKYDVYVSEADDNKTMRMEILQDLTEMAKAGMPVPPDLLIDYMDLSNSEEVKARIQQYMQQQIQAAAQKTAKG